MAVGEVRTRLRVGHRVVGYEKEVQGMTFFSKDLLWWSGTRIDHDARDAALGFRDKNDRPLFDQDVVVARWSASGEERRLHLRLTGTWLEAFDIDGGESLPADHVREASLEFVGYSIDDESSL